MQRNMAARVLRAWEAFESGEVSDFKRFTRGCEWDREWRAKGRTWTAVFADDSELTMWRDGGSLRYEVKDIRNADYVPEILRPQASMDVIAIEDLFRGSSNKAEVEEL